GRLGGAVSRELGASGYRVGVLYHREREAASECVAAIDRQGGGAVMAALDLADPGSMERCLREVEMAFGAPPALLVQCAGRFAPTPVEAEPEWEGIERLMRINLQGPLWLALRVARTMNLGAGGQIILMGDIWGERPLRGHAAYSAAKAGLLMATRALAKDFAPRVRVNAIAPGALLPPETPHGPSAEGYRQLLARTPLAEQAGPQAVLHALRYLLDAPFVTGEILRVDGGRLLH
ncbi:MAG: SDR family oxidoreductase, partial [Magnetococcales bacterium]|nr:SDR family oxidoreductase [Magnetococcales bacterium]